MPQPARLPPDCSPSFESVSERPVRGRDGSLGRLPRVPILRGPLRGRWYLPASGGKFLNVLVGTYEAREAALFARHVARGDTVLDLGAHVGYYTLLAGTLAGPEGRVIAFEPLPRNCFYLRRHVELNRLRNVTVHEAAVGERRGYVFFDPGPGAGRGRVEPGGPLRVRMVSLDDFVREQRILPRVIKIDVEGAETRVLAGAEQLLRWCRPVLFLSTHGHGLGRECRRVLEAWGYRVEPPTGRDLLCTPRERP